jgi:hypothetical protein
MAKKVEVSLTLGRGVDFCGNGPIVARRSQDRHNLRLPQRTLPKIESMADDKTLELAGPLFVIGTIACAQVGAHALASWPTSSFLWYLNLEVFRSFQYGVDLGHGWFLGQDGLAQSVWIAIPLLALICAGLALKRRLPLAVASHLSLIYSAFAAYQTVVYRLAGSWNPSVFLAAGILLGSILSSTISHRSYWREIFS